MNAAQFTHKLTEPVGRWAAGTPVALLTSRKEDDGEWTCLVSAKLGTPTWKKTFTVGLKKLRRLTS